MELRPPFFYLQFVMMYYDVSRFPGGLTTLHLAGNEAVKWLGMHCKR